MENKQAVESDRTIEASTKVFDIGKVSEETKGLMVADHETPTIHPGQFTGA